MAKLNLIPGKRYKLGKTGVTAEFVGIDENEDDLVFKKQDINLFAEDQHGLIYLMLSQHTDSEFTKVEDVPNESSSN